MKKLFYLILFLLPFTLKAQTIDTAYKAYPSCKITPIFIKIPGLDSLQAERLQMTYFTADFASKNIEVHYSFTTLSGDVIYSGIEFFTQVEYGTILNLTIPTVFSYLGTKLNINYQ